VRADVNIDGIFKDKAKRTGLIIFQGQEDIRATIRKDPFPE
jgi:hypothetical protein